MWVRALGNSRVNAVSLAPSKYGPPGNKNERLQVCFYVKAPSSFAQRPNDLGLGLRDEAGVRIECDRARGNAVLLRRYEPGMAAKLGKVDQLPKQQCLSLWCGALG